MYSFGLVPFHIVILQLIEFNEKPTGQQRVGLNALGPQCDNNGLFHSFTLNIWTFGGVDAAMLLLREYFCIAEKVLQRDRKDEG